MAKKPAKKLQSAKTLTAYPYCNGLGLLLTHADGEHHRAYSQFRINMNAWSKFVTEKMTYRQRDQWYRNSKCLMFQSDDMGYLPDAFEKFLSAMYGVSVPARQQRQLWNPAPAE